MSDFLLGLSHNKSARNLIKTLGLPVPLPPELRRAVGPWSERPLAGRAVIVHGGTDAAAAERLVGALGQAGADVSRGEAGDHACHALVFDATGLRTVAQLAELHAFLHPRLPDLERNGRVLVVGRPAAELDGEAAAVQAALPGFVRSLGREIGRRGATANLLVVQEGAEARVDGPARWLLSERSAFVSGQPISITAAVKGQAQSAWVRPLGGKVALVTGAARGIGAETVARLAAEGAHVVCLDRPADESLTREVASAHGGSVLSVDITNPEAPGRIAAHLTEAHGGVDIVIHNAGITRDKTLAKMTEAYWTQVLEVNLASILRITPALLDGPLREGGRIVCLSSIAGISGNFGQTNYAASKSAVIGFVTAQAPALAARGVTINAIAPGFIETRLTAEIPLMLREIGRRLNALSQGGVPQDIAEAVTFLASPDALGITGNVLRVCGLNLAGA